MSETKRHLEARTTLYLLLKDAFTTAAVGSDQFVYYDASDPRKCLAPDVFVKLGAREEAFDNWKVWERAAPDLAIEVVSASDRRDEDWATKLERYQASGIRELVRFDPENAARPIQVWDRVEGELLERSPESADFHECAVLGSWWMVRSSEYGPMLRLARDPHGTELFPTPSEDRVAAENRRFVAEQELREAHAEIERLRAELARARGEKG